MYRIIDDVHTDDVVATGEIIYRYFAVPGRPGSVAHSPLLAFSTGSVYTWPIHADIMPGYRELLGLIGDKIGRLVLEVKRLTYSDYIGNI